MNEARSTTLAEAERGVDDAEGSILPLVLGYVVLALALILVCVCATDLHIAQKRLDALADAAALAGADGFSISVTSDAVRAELSAQGIHDQAAALLGEIAPDAELVSATSPDGVTAVVTVARPWHPPLLSLFIPDGILLQSTATSRTALR